MPDGPTGTEAVRRRAAAAFRTASRGRIGAELEWITYRIDDPRAPVRAADVAAALGEERLPAGGRLSIEPGGQVELSTLPARSPARLLDDIDADVAALQSRLRRAGLAPAALGVDPLRPAAPSLRAARYELMEAFFARHSPAGLEMMALTAATQVNLDFGADPARRVAEATLLAPVLGALFANSPVRAGRPASHASQRLGIWAETEPTRTAPLDDPSPAGWARYALGARVMMIHDGRPAPGGLAPGGLAPGPPEAPTLEQWLAGQPGGAGEPDCSSEADRTGGGAGGADLEATVAMHLTTLFPPVRPRGYMELRVLDALPRPVRRAAVAVTWALLAHDGPAAAAARLCAPAALRASALTTGLADPAVADAAAGCASLAIDVLARTDPDLADGCQPVLESILAADRTRPPGVTPEDVVAAALSGPV